MIRRFSPQAKPLFQRQACAKGCEKVSRNLCCVNKRKQHRQLDAVDFPVGNWVYAPNAGIDNKNSNVKVTSVDG
jgi:hypothetical protein